MRNADVDEVESLLRSVEDSSVSACNRYLMFNNLRDHIWILRGEDGKPAALIIHSRSTVIPVLCGLKNIPKPRILKPITGKINIHSLQGITDEVVIVQEYLQQMKKELQDVFDFDLMSIDTLPDLRGFSDPANLVLRRPSMLDLDAIASLHGAYEREEVIPKGSIFNPAVCRAEAQEIIVHSDILAAELDGRIIGKINVNAVSFTRFQVGGVYVHPDFRGKGIARQMAYEFISSLIKQGRGVTLFVKKANIAAYRLYTGLGFKKTADYRICYY
jgi:ribosomal protein S18 acetylase RimI-like enzyme